MKAAVNDEVVTLDDLSTDFSDRVIPRGTRGTVVEAYTVPHEAYAVDLAIPDATLAGGHAYDNVVLTPDQFDVVKGEPRR